MKQFSHLERFVVLLEVLERMFVPPQDLEGVITLLGNISETTETAEAKARIRVTIRHLRGKPLSKEDVWTQLAADNELPSEMVPERLLAFFNRADRLVKK